MPQPPVITGFKLNARFPSGSPALGVCRAEGLRSHTTAGTQGGDCGRGTCSPGSLYAFPLWTVGQRPFAVINRSHEDNHMLRS